MLELCQDPIAVRAHADKKLQRSCNELFKAIGISPEPGYFDRRTSMEIASCYFRAMLAHSAHEPETARSIVVGSMSEEPWNVNAAVVRLNQHDASQQSLFEGVRLALAGEGKTPSFGHIDDDRFRQFRESYAQAEHVIATVVPAVAQEQAAFLDTILLTDVPTAVSTGGFGGVTSMFLWGATVVNIRTYETPIEIAAMLVHELTHHVLLALTAETPLVLNEASEQFASPLRTDLRPMDGVFHATLVAGRLSGFFNYVSHSAATADEAAELRKVSGDLNTKFRDGLQVIETHGILSEAGRVVLDSGRDRWLNA